MDAFVARLASFRSTAAAAAPDANNREDLIMGYGEDEVVW